jgi:murein DD-endopeptidase MepM/ murein hydrolase activator NlpD
VALIGVATIMLGGCSETGQFGNMFGAPYASTSPQVDRTPTGSVAQAQPQPGSQISNFFSEAFRPFGSEPAAQPAPRAARRAPRASQTAYAAPIPPEPISSAPLAPPAPVASYPASAPISAPRPTYALRSNPNSVGGWTAQGGTPVVVAQGETAEIIAQRYGVPTETLLTLNGYGPRSQIPPGARLTIPVYGAKGARTAIAPAPLAAAAPVRAAETQRFGSRSLVAEEMQQAKHGASARMADARTLARAERDKAEKEAAEKARMAQSKAEKEKDHLAKSEGAKAEAAKKLAEARDGREAQKLAAVQKFAEAKPLSAKLTPAKAEETTRVAKLEPAKAARSDASEATASLPPPAMAAAASDSANPEFRWPARGRVIQGFGAGGNDGINIAVPEGTQVKAAEGGVVAYAGSELKGYGNLVLIRHPNGFVTAYANNGSLNVKRGETVKRGQVIALSGQSGNVSSPQLHFELRKGSKPVDPSTYLAGL